MTDEEAIRIGNDIIAMSHKIEPRDYYNSKWILEEREYRAFLRGVEAMAEKTFEYFRNLLSQES